MTEEQTIIEEKKTNKVLEFFKGIGTIALYFILAILGSILFGYFHKNSNIVIATVSQIGTYMVLLIGLGIVYRKRLINDFKNFKKENLKIALKNWILGLIVMIIANLIITSIVGDLAANENANRELLKAYPVSNIIIMVIIAPLIEEITFRASFQKAFSKWYTFALVTGFLFGLAHIAEFNLLEFLFIIPYGALGFFFAAAMYETNNIYTSYFAHMLHNALCILLIIFLI